jgi:TatD DNase family protein
MNRSAILCAVIELADSHGHLTMVFPGQEARWPTRPATDDEVAELVSRARDAGVTRILVPATTLEDAPQAVEVAERFEGVFAAVGVHPHETKAFDEDLVIPALERLAASAKVVAIGEIGLDYFYDFAPKDDQKRALVAQLKLAERLGRPVLLHNRESEEDLLAILEAEAKGSADRLRGVFHSFCASTATGENAIALGYLVSYSGMITFRMAENVRESAAALPLSSMMVETDAPYLAPAPFRGKPNEPAYVGRTAARLAEVKGVSLADVAAATTANFRRLFGTP